MKRPMIPIYDPRPEVEELWDELQAAIAGVLRSGQFIMGPNVLALEQEVAQYLGVKHAVALNSGTDALVIALRALGIGPGDEVITTPFTFFATAEAVSSVGATPVFVDIDPATYNINPVLVPTAITKRTKAIIPVHLFGLPCEMGALVASAREHGLKVIEDCAQSFGASYRGIRTGAIGDVGCLSFFPTKNLGAFGDGGMLVTSDDGVAEQARMLRQHGSKVKYQNEIIGYNSRLDEIQAAILRVKLPLVDKRNLQRRTVATQYASSLRSLEGVVCPATSDMENHVFHQYTIRVAAERRHAIRDKMCLAGVQTAIYYPKPLNQLKAYSTAPTCPSAEMISRQVISLPIGPMLDNRSLSAVAEALRRSV